MAHMFFVTAESVIAADRIYQRIQFHEKAMYSRIVARIPADLEHACRRLAEVEGWELETYTVA